MTTVTQVTSSISNSILVRTIEDNWLDLGTAVEFTIASGSISPTQTNIKVDTEADASTDDLTDIQNGQDGRVLVLRTVDDARDVVVKHSAGTGAATIELNGAVDFTMSGTSDTVVLMHNGVTWVQIGGGNNV